MRVLVACEESQVVCKAFRAKGHEAYSCDIQECSGGHPEWHIVSDVLKVIKGGFFNTQNGDLIEVWNWDLMIAHPPCTYLTVTGNKWMKPEFADRFPTRQQDREEAVSFFMTIANAPVEKIAIENPIGIMSSIWRKPDQIIQPYYFGDPERKTTCLWLKNLSGLMYATEDTLFELQTSVEPKLYTYADGRTDGIWHVETMKLPKQERTRARSKTFDGIANAMADQWG